ncbi:MAG: HAMP domain-containing protein [Candidatus Lindowbacteria bacterium]|nr:HAMP domain-containing protein [Candidatus Lindowbacteria bacterium]
MYALIRSHLSSELDRRLHRKLEWFAQLVELRRNEEIRLREEDGELKIWDKEGGEEGMIPFGRVDFVEVSSTNGRISLRFPDAGPRHPEHMRYQTVTHKFEGNTVVVRLGISELQMEEFLSHLLLLMGFGIPVALLLSLVGGWLLAGRTLSPISQMASQATRISAENLSNRLPVIEPRDELSQLAMVFNETFSRLERSFEQMRNFTFDASHELRTPLTAIRATGEVALRVRRSADEYRETIGSMLEEVERLTQLVENLLLLSRSERPIPESILQPSDATQIAHDVIETLGVLAEEKTQRITIAASKPVPILSDPTLLRQAFGNLLENAIKYSPPGSEIRVTVAPRGDKAVLEVSDSGPGISAEHQTHLFERFYRVDKSRSREMGGYGLGLAITQWIVEAHSGSVELESSEGKGSVFRIVLPTRPST